MALFNSSPLLRSGGMPAPTLLDPPLDAINITPAMISDSKPLPIPLRGIVSTVAGVVCVIGGLGLQSLRSLPANERESGVIVQIKATGTDAALKAADGNGNTPLLGLI